MSTAPPAPHAVDLLDAAAADAPGAVFLRGARTMTFAEVAHASQRVAAWLDARGVTAGDRLVIAAANHPDAIVTALGAARLGVTFVFVHDAIRPAGFARILEQVEPACVLLDDATARLRPAVGDVPVLACDTDRLDGATPTASLVAPAAAAGGLENTRVDPLCLVYTSGSTGVPRGVMVSHANVAFSAAAIQERLRYRSDDTIGLFLPLSFDYGLYQVFLALAARATLYVGALEGLAFRLLGALEREKITVLPGIPSLFSALVGMIARGARPPARLRAVTNTGERLAPETVERLRAELPGLEVFLMYGLTECKRVSILLPEELAARPVSVGRALRGTTAEVMLPDGSTAPDGVPGELVVQGPHLTLGYWRAPMETARRFRTAPDGTRTLFTGDTCRRDRDGFLYFEGRGDAQVKRHGFRMSLREIESAALGVPGVVAAAAVALSEDDLHLFVTRTGSGLTPEALLRVLREQLEPYKVPDRVHVVQSLPTTPHGKLDRARLSMTAEHVA
ncbi:MAG: AMP-binding protein [Actinomycetota bacterium]|nr:AMP-binding protein [Actinomycetota bacterium]